MKIIAVEEHVLLPSLFEILPEGFDAHRRISWLTELNPALQQINGWPTPFPPGLGDLGEGRLRDMDSGGIETQVVSAGGINDLPVETTRKVNDALAAAAAEHPGRLLGFATLPMLEPEAAAAELERAVTQLGFVGTMIFGHVNGRYLDDLVFDPIFACAETLDVPVYLHPTPPPQSVIDTCYKGFHPQVSAVFSMPGLGWHADVLVHLTRLILGGVFDRHPGLQVIIGHMGEGLPWLYWRAPLFDNLPATGLKRKFNDYLRENVHATTCDYVNDVTTAFGVFLGLVHTIGVDRIMASADYPFGDCVKTRKLIEALPISEADREKVAFRNAERLFKLPGSA